MTTSTPRRPGDDDRTREDEVTQPLEPVTAPDEPDEQIEQDEQDDAPTAALPHEAGAADAAGPESPAGAEDTHGARDGDDTLVLPADGTTRPLEAPVTAPVRTSTPVAPAAPVAARASDAATDARRDGAAPGEAAAPAPAEHRPTLRVGTVVWGLVLAAIGVGVLAWAGGASIDLQLATIVLLAAAGTALLVGSLVSGARRSRR
ncbi:hypothetical protein [Cellulomonas massiliensis]|uniref:hypothetical protein n=1 Tax=Cellulomonas massiliensis TaxID=1465811 RepID=UPI0002E7777A|nr:hypothetical protein [Cellulomonas massiliensis]